MKAYKLLRLLKKDGLLHPLFINKENPTPLGVWMRAECFPTKGFAVRKGFHCCFTPLAPHLKMKLSNGEQRVWVECDVEDWETYDRPESQGGAWILAQRMRLVRVISEEEADKIRNSRCIHCNGRVCLIKKDVICYGTSDEQEKCIKE